MNIQDLHDLIRLLEEHPDWRAELRRILLTRELLELPELVREIAAIQRQHSELLAHHAREIKALRALVAQLVEAQRRTEQRVEELAEAQRRTEEQVAALRTDTESRFQDLVEQIRRLSMTVDRLVDWQRGEAGRREGELYEQHTLRRAPNLFFGGEGGNASEFSVRRRITMWLKPYYDQQQVPEPLADPLLADIIWWKGDEVVVAAVSHKVNGQDVRRARLRANTLLAVGIQAIPVVIGEEWATPESQALAQEEGVEWMVGSGVSQGFLRFRRLRAESTSEAT